MDTRAKTLLHALGIEWRGFFVSAAAIAILSTPAKLKTALAVLDISLVSCGRMSVELTHHCPETQELSPRAGGDVLDKRSRLFPVPEADTRCARHASKVNDQSQDDQEDDEYDLEERKPEFNLAVNPDCRETYRDRQDNRDDDPYRRVDVYPVLEEDAYSADFSWDGQQISIDEVVAILVVSFP
jgi:hypothetical protein